MDNAIVYLPHLGAVAVESSHHHDETGYINMSSAVNCTSYDCQGSSSHQAFDNLWPALVQCFSVMVFGYIAGRVALVSEVQIQGLGTYLSNFALPALLFRSLAGIEFTMVNWMFLLSILVVKFAVFVIVAVLTLLVSRPTNLGKIGIYSIFVTQSNDIALGYPIIDALYPSLHHNSMEVNYLYLIQPISLVILNPLGFVFLEIHHWRRLPMDQRKNKFKAVFTVVKGIVSNPIVFMSALGIVANFALKRHIPCPIDNILKTLADSFSAVALFFLGHNMVGKFSTMNGRTILTALLLIASKMLLMPFLAREITTLFLRHGTSTTDVAQLSSFAFLYGTLPTAPVVFIFASQYHIAQAVISTSVVLATFMALPLMFVSAEMVMIKVTREKDFVLLLNRTAFDVSWLTVVSCMWVLFIFAVGRRFRSVPHQFTICLALAQLVCVSGLMLLVKINTLHHWWNVFIFCLHMIGSLSCHSFVTMIAVCLSTVRIYSLCFVLRHKGAFFMYGFGFPIFTVGLILMTTWYDSNKEQNILLPYGKHQVIITIIYIVINVSISVGALICQHRHDRSYLGSRSRTTSENDAGLSSSAVHDRLDSLNVQVPQQETDETDPVDHSIESHSYRSTHGSRGHKRVRIRVKARRAPLPQSAECQGCNVACQGTGAIEDLAGACASINDVTEQNNVTTERTPLLNGSQELNNYTSLRLSADQSVADVDEHMCDRMRYTCNNRQECCELLGAYMERRFYALDDEEVTMLYDRDEHQVLRHVVTVILLLLVQLAVLFLCIWRVFNEQLTGLYIELEFFNVVLISGQGVFLLGMFGFDSSVTMYPLFRRIKEALRLGTEVTLPELSEVSESVLNICDVFRSHHLQQCRQEIVSCYWYRLRRYQCVFRGCDLIDWLLDIGLCTDRNTALEYGSTLLEGRIIEHVQKRHYFYDLPYLYKFIEQ